MNIRILLTFGLLAGGCVSDEPVERGRSSGELVAVSAVSGGGVPGGDGTSLHIDAGGTATRTTRDNGTQTATLDAATVADVRRKIDDAQFPTLAPSYGCSCADESVYHLSAPLDGTAYEVDAATTAGTPAPLIALIGTLRDILRRPLDWH